MPVGLETPLRQFVPGTRGIAAAALHQFVEGFEIGARLALGKEIGGAQDGQLFGDGSCNELIDAGASTLLCSSTAFLSERGSRRA
jgi:hypothetical protein